MFNLYNFEKKVKDEEEEKHKVLKEIRGFD